MGVFAAVIPTIMGVTAFTIFITNTVVLCTILFVVRLSKALVPMAAWQRTTTRALMAIGSLWIDVNSWGLRITQNHIWDVEGVEGVPGLFKEGWYLVASNHRSVADIVVLQQVFNHKIPFLKFFLKQQLIWVPFLGLTWWSLDFPFMKRYSRAELKRRPELRGKDLETTRKACEKFRLAPMSIINFLEGTRVSEEKRLEQKSPYKHLLLPRAGGIAFVLSALGDHLTSFVDVTIVYPDGDPSFWEVLSRGLTRIVVRVKSIPIPPDLIGGDYVGDAAYRERVQAFVREIWIRKDAEIEQILSSSKSVSRPA
jgi:1-acyl-sn-glycerol-3-phosphate acyltransferase